MDIFIPGKNSTPSPLTEALFLTRNSWLESLVCFARFLVITCFHSDFFLNQHTIMVPTSTLILSISKVGKILFRGFFWKNVLLAPKISAYGRHGKSTWTDFSRIWHPSSKIARGLDGLQVIKMVLIFIIKLAILWCAFYENVTPTT